ncbi:MAG: Mur ligase family protein, partial [Patescibacteria group bacterium]
MQVRPRIVGITGSVGKTSTKESIASVLERRFKIVKSQKNYNTEYGAILTILDQTGGGSSWSKWGKVLIESLKSALKKPDPYDVLVIEMGVDKPGDMSEILKIFSPDVMVFLNVKDVHRAEGQFPNREA